MIELSVHIEKEFIAIDELMDYINSAFESDDELVDIYDPSVKVSSVKEVCENVYEKIESLIDPCSLIGVSIDGDKAGYFAYSHNMLISFGLNKKYRNREYLIEFWGMIKDELGDSFQCALFSVNKRGIDWLKRQGMEILFENITILNYKNLNP